MLTKENAAQLVGDMILLLKKFGEKFVMDVEHSDERNALFTPDFPAESLWNALGNLQMIGSIISFEGGAEASYLIFTDQDGYRYRVLFNSSSGFGYRIEDLHSECPICFGTGFNDGSNCEMCTSGWIIAK